jgi:hypothetical protein
VKPTAKGRKVEDDTTDGTKTVQRRDGYDLEDRFQSDTAKYLDAVLPDDAYWCHIPNGGKRPKKTAGMLKKHGVKAGALDNLIIRQGLAYWLELKARYGTLKDSQILTIPKLKAAGSQVGIARTLEDVEFHLKLWGIPVTMTLDEYRTKQRQPTRMSAADYRAVMTQATDKQRKREASWQKKLASRQPSGKPNLATSKSN